MGNVLSPGRVELPSSITTSRLFFRPWQDFDADILTDYQMRNRDPLALWYGGLLAKKDASPRDIADHIQNTIAGSKDISFIEYAVFSADDNELVGTGSLHTIDKTVPKARIGYTVDSSQNGKGYATDIANVMTRLAFDRLHLERLEIRTATRNPASGKIPRKLGYNYLAVFEKNKRGSDSTLWDLEIHVRFDPNDLPDIDVTYHD